MGHHTQMLRKPVPICLQRRGQCLNVFGFSEVRWSLGDVLTDTDTWTILSGIREDSAGGLFRVVKVMDTERLRGRFTKNRRVTLWLTTGSYHPNTTCLSHPTCGR